MGLRDILISTIYRDIFERDLVYGHIADVDIIQICVAILAPGKLRTRSDLLLAWTLTEHLFSLCEKKWAYTSYIDIEPRYIGISPSPIQRWVWLLTSII